MIWTIVTIACVLLVVGLVLFSPTYHTTFVLVLRLILGSLIWLSQRVFGTVPGWMQAAYAWTTPRLRSVGRYARRLMMALLWILIGAIVSIPVGALTGQHWLVSSALVCIGLVLWLLYGLLQLAGGIVRPIGNLIKRIAVKLGAVPADLVIDTGLTKTLLTLAWSSVFLAIIVLAGGDGLHLDGRMIALIGFTSILFAMVGTSMGWLQKASPWIATVIFGWMIVHQTFGWNSDLGLRALSEALQERGAVARYQAADQIEPNIPARLAEKHRQNRRQFVADEIGRYTSTTNRLLAVSKTRSLTGEETKEYEDAYTKVIQFQQELKSLDSKAESSGPSFIAGFKPVGGSVPWYFYGIPLIAIFLGCVVFLFSIPAGGVARGLLRVGVIAVIVLDLIFLGPPTLYAYGLDLERGRQQSNVMFGFPSFGSVSQETLESSPAIQPDPMRTDFHDNLTRAVAISSQYGVPPQLVAGLIRRESSWDPHAQSPKGAKGLMQLIDSTAKQYDVADPYDPEQNIRGGVRFLADLIGKYHGDYTKVLAAYNCGPDCVDSILANNPQANLLALVPAETREYVPDVLHRAGSVAGTVGAYQAPAQFATFPVFQPTVQQTLASDGTGIISVTATTLPNESPEFDLPAGSYMIRASGSVNGARNSFDGAHRDVGPEGWNRNPDFLSGRPLVVSGAPFMSAVALLSINGQTSAIPVGRAAEIELPEPGKIRFTVNDTIQEAPTSYLDNVGSLAFQISRM